jgi:DNA-binding FadR family transcriptional regulator
MVEMLRMARGYGGDADQDAHARLLDAVQAGDGQAAAALSRAHLLAMKQRLS